MPHQGRGCSTTFLIIEGVILLSPGALALVFGLIIVHDRLGSNFWIFMICLLAGYLGIILLRAVHRGSSAPRRDRTKIAPKIS
jgi:hypothetical protein